MNKRRPFVLLMALVLALSMAACGEKEAPIDPQYVAQLEQKVIDLQAQVDSLSKELDEMARNAVLKDYSMKAIARSDSSGALVDITAVPMAHRDGQTALFTVTLDGEQIISQEAIWTGEAYTATLDLDAADGYGYYCILTEADGTEKQAVLATVDNPVYDTCIYLASGLNPYCNMFVKNWTYDEEALTLSSGFIQLQLPRIVSDKGLGYSSSELVLQLNGEEIQRQSVTLPQGEGEGSYELPLTDITFDMPEMEDDYQLDLWLNVTLTDGSVLTQSGCSWTYNGGDLSISVG